MWIQQNTPKIVKENAEEFVPLITHIINLSFENGTVPWKLKLAKVIPILKKKKKMQGIRRPSQLQANQSTQLHQ